MAEEIIKSYGKINLSLNISGVRDDGYHSVETVMQKISLCDTVSVKWTPAESRSIEISLDSNKIFLPKDERNIAYKAAALLAEKFSEKIGGGKIEIYLDKHIPVSAGLAGGSGNGAAVLTALNKLWGVKLSTRALCRLGAGLGADVPFCVLTQNSKYGCALGEGTGAELTAVKSRFKRALLLVKPAFGVSTKEVYQGIDGCVISERPDTSKLTDSLRNGDVKAIYEQMINVLEVYTLDKYEEVRNIKREIEKETAAEKVLMTGSGPTVFGLFSNTEEAKEACGYMRGKGYEAYWAKTL